MNTIVGYKWLIAVTVIAAVVRLYMLGAVPPSPDWDEAALGYNAYSILSTGRDEYGTLLPVSLRSFDDYKPPLYVYLAIPSIAMFGLTTWAVRLPSVVMGVLAVVGTYFLVKELFIKSQISMTNDQRGKKTLIGNWKLEIGNSKSIALLSAMLLAISPWHIQFSRIAFEANIGVTLNVWAVVCFLRGRRSLRWLLLGAILFGVALYAYHSERIFVPLLVSILAVACRKELIAQKKNVLFAGLAGLLIVMPLIPVFFSQNTLTRLRGTSALADQTGLLRRSVAKLEDDRISGNPWGVVFDNRRIVWAKTLLDGYLSHFSLRWLFLTGDNPRHHAPDMGLLYLFELPFLFLGMYLVAKRAGSVRTILFGWFFVAPIAAAPTTELPHAIRTLVFLPTFQIFTALGILEVLSNIKYQIFPRSGIHDAVITHGFANSIGTNIHIKYKKYAILLISGFYILFLIFNISYYFHMYFVHMSREVSQYWQYGYEQAVRIARENHDRYRKIVVSTKLEQPHMFFLYFLAYDPKKYLAEGGTASGGFAEVRNRFDTYEFRPIVWEKEIKDGSTLFIGTPQEIPTANVASVYYLDGSEAIRIAQQ